MCSAAVLELGPDPAALPRSPGQRLAPRAPELGAPMLVNGQPSWLVVSGRSRTEPFDAADTALLEALGAVGAGALTNGTTTGRAASSASGWRRSPQASVRGCAPSTSRPG